MRGSTWPSGYIRQIHRAEDVAPGPPVQTISGVLHMRDTIFGHKWVYKLNETRKGTELELKKRVGCSGHLVGSFSVVAVVILIVFGIVFTVFGPKYLNTLDSTYHNSNKSVHLDYPKIQQRTKIIFNTTKNDTSTNLIDVEFTNITATITNEHLHATDEKLKIKGCSKCTAAEICLQNASKIFPECIPVKDLLDPTGCGGLCKLEVQYCKLLDTELKIYSCIDIETLACAENQWKCENTLLCIENTNKCDGTIHCFDKSDELNCDCDLKKNFRCSGNISCIPNSKRCDGSVDCWDATDEKNCTHECGPLNVPCYNGECIENQRFCDGVIDCQDKSDEPFGCIT